jgi:DNA-binding ferritin-like protein
VQKPDKVEVEELAVERKRLQKIGEKFTFSSHLRSAINSISERIEQLGGTAEEKRQAAKAAKAAARKTAKKKANPRSS